MKLLKKLFKPTLTLVMTALVAVSTALAGPDTLGNLIDSIQLVSPSDPLSFVTPQATNSLEIAITMILGLFAGIIPGLRSIPRTFIRTAAAALLVVAGAATFKLGFLTPESLEYAIGQFLPNFAYAGLLYNLLRYLLPLIGTWLGKDWSFFKSIKPSA